MVTLRYTRNLFLRSMCVVYLFAFISFYIQIPGLYGDNGILPAKSVLENSKHKTLLAKIHALPTFLWLVENLGLDTNYGLDVLALFGSLLAFSGFVSHKFCTLPMYGTMWSIYFSLYQIGQVFVASHYDQLLLEAGFLTLFLAPVMPGGRKGSKSSNTDGIGMWLIRWLLFRFFLSSGLTKFLSGCPKWWSLTALNYHFAAMPLPSPLSWYAHQLPQSVLKLSSVYANVCELILPFLFLLPLTKVRRTGFVFQLFLQSCIVLTGNFNFVNLLLVTLLLSLLDDRFFFGRRRPLSDSAFIVNLFNILLHGVIFYFVVKFFAIKFQGSTVVSEISFSRAQFDFVVKQGLLYAVYYALISLVLTMINSLLSLLFDNQNHSTGKVLSIVSTLLYSTVVLIVFMVSAVPLASFSSSANSTVDPTVRVVYKQFNKVHAINEYGLFDKMTGIDGRPEIILEGANNVDGPWHEYNFLYKPGNVNHSLPFVAPYSPRIDWQMYWAAYSTYTKQPWLLSLTHRLLTGTPEVESLLDRNHFPFAKQPPKFIRASLYKYKYTTWAQRAQEPWWTREKVSEYFPAFSKDSPVLLDYLKARNLLPTASNQSVNPIWKNALDSIRYVTSHLEPTLLLWSVFTAGCAIISTTGKSNK